MGRNRLKALFALSLLLLDSAGLLLSFQIAFFVRFQWPPFMAVFPVTKGFPDRLIYEQTLGALLPVWLLVFFHTGFYKNIHLSAYDEFIHVIKGVLLCSLLTTAMTFAYRGTEYSRLVIALWSVLSAGMIYLLRETDKLLFRRLLYWRLGPERILIVGKGKVVEAIRQMAFKEPFIQASFLESAPKGQALENYFEENWISEVLLVQGGLPSESILEISTYCERLNMDCKIVPDILEIRRGEIIVDGFLGLPTFHIKPLSLHGTNYLLKRSFDVFLSLLILAALFIPLLFIGLLIYLDNPGPILYTQDRLGLRANRFKLVKFRTMIMNADALLKDLRDKSDRPGPVFKMKQDPRVTRVGRWLRKYSLDEIPQLINVLRGDMSLVGPRPQVLWEAATYDETAKKRLRVKPGITGLWQVSGRAALSFEEMIDLDIYYLENWSLGLDLKILLRTLPVVFAGQGAY